jgi:hypothetical protein
VNRPLELCAGLCVLAGSMFGAGVALAQESKSALAPPKVLVVFVENLKPGKGGAMHEKTESAYQHALGDAKSSNYYLAMNAISGPPRALFLYRYESFAEAGKQRAMEHADSELSTALDAADVADGDLLTTESWNAYSFREDLSHVTPLDLAKMRYMDITRITVKPGHRSEFEEYMKLNGAAITKAVPDARFTTFESQYGWENGGVYLIFRPLRSLEEVDTRLANAPKVREATGDGGKRLGELAASCIQSSQRNLYTFDPQMSYLPDDWSKSDPFWQHKATK